MKFYYLIAAFLLLLSCSKEPEVPSVKTEQLPLENISISGEVKIPEDSNIDVNGWHVNSGLASDVVANNQFTLEEVNPDFSIIFLSDNEGNDRLLGLVYPGETELIINSESTVLSLLMKMPIVQSLSREGQLNLVKSIRSDQKFKELVENFEAIFKSNEPLFSINNENFNNELASYFESSTRTPEANTNNVKIIRSGRNFTVQNLKNPFVQVVGIYKDGVQVKKFTLDRYQYFISSLVELPNAINNHSPEIIEETFTLNGDGIYHFKVRTGRPFSGNNDPESKEAWGANLSNAVIDNLAFLVKSIPWFNLNNQCVNKLRDVTLNRALEFTSLLDQTDGSFISFSSIITQVTISTLDYAQASNECLRTADQSKYFGQIKNLTKHYDFISSIGSYMNTSIFLTGYALVPAAADFCYNVQGNFVEECKGEWYIGKYTITVSEIGENYDGKQGEIYFYITPEKRVSLTKSVIPGFPDIYHKIVGPFDCNPSPTLDCQLTVVKIWSDTNLNNTLHEYTYANNLLFKYQHSIGNPSTLSGMIGGGFQIMKPGLNNKVVAQYFLSGHAQYHGSSPLGSITAEEILKMKEF